MIAVDKEHLLGLLGSLGDVAEQDLRRCLVKSKTTDPERAKWIMQSAELRRWLNDVGTSVLLINGNVEGNETFSATTFFAAKLLTSLEMLEPIVTLKFFCSLHNANKAGAAGMVKSLFTQLLLHDFGWDLTFLVQYVYSALKILLSDLRDDKNMFQFLHIPSTSPS